MSIVTEITRLQTAKSSIKDAIEAKGVSIPSTAKLDAYNTYISQIPTGQPPVMQAKTATPTTATQTITPDTGYDGLSSVEVSAVTSAIDSNIVAGNIKKDVSILGVTGTFEGSGGGISGWDVVFETDVNLSATSTTATKIADISIPTTISAKAWFVIEIVDNDQTHEGDTKKFLRSTSLLYASSPTVNGAARINGAYMFWTGSSYYCSSGAYGLYSNALYDVNYTGHNPRIEITARCNANYFASINGNYHIRVLRSNVFNV